MSSFADIPGKDGHNVAIRPTDRPFGYVVRCAICGRWGGVHDNLVDAKVVAERHAEIGGFEGRQPMTRNTSAAKTFTTEHEHLDANT